MEPWRQTLAKNPDLAALMPEDVTFTLPAASYGSIWESELSTAEPLLEARAREYAARSKLEVRSRSVYVLRRGPLGST